MAEVKPVIDWVHLPGHSNPESFWGSFHDACITCLRSDLLARTVEIELDEPHIREFHQFDTECRFVIELRAVKSARAIAAIQWPGPVPEQEGKTPDERTRILADYWEKWREESLDWNTLVATIPTNPLSVSTSEFVRDESTITLRFSGHLDGNEVSSRWTELYIRADSMRFGLNDGTELTLEQYAALGDRAFTGTR